MKGLDHKINDDEKKIDDEDENEKYILQLALQESKE